MGHIGNNWKISVSGFLMLKRLIINYDLTPAELRINKEMNILCLNSKITRLEH